jgi:dopamine beta-monooxygenase
MLEIYYNNIHQMKGKLDNSGIRLYVTPSLRQNDVGVLSVTTDASPLSLQIPGKSKHFHVSIICYPQCTEVI